jgi:hypothetical protein
MLALRRAIPPADRLPFLTQPEKAEDKHDDDHNPNDVEHVVHAQSLLRRLLVTDEFKVYARGVPPASARVGALLRGPRR